MFWLSKGLHRKTIVCTIRVRFSYQTEISRWKEPFNQAYWSAKEPMASALVWRLRTEEKSWMLVVQKVALNWLYKLSSAPSTIQWAISVFLKRCACWIVTISSKYSIMPRSRSPMRRCWSWLVVLSIPIPASVSLLPRRMCVSPCIEIE